MVLVLPNWSRYEAVSRAAKQDPLEEPATLLLPVVPVDVAGWTVPIPIPLGGGGRSLLRVGESAATWIGRSTGFLRASPVVRTGARVGAGAAAVGAGLWVAGTGAGAGARSLREGIFGAPDEPGALGSGFSGLLLLAIAAVAVVLLLRK